LAALVENDLGAVAEELCPPTAALREQLLAGDALAAAVSGSGSAVFGLFADGGIAEAARERLAPGAHWTAVTRLWQGAAGATITP
jgi:4-diphosphocytidyl-2-C-methyl-D-erythritol kinase